MPKALVAVVLAAVLCAACSSGSNKSATTSKATSATSASTPSTQAGASNWPTYHHDNARTGVADDQTPLGQPTKGWESADLDGAVYAQPLVAGDKVLVATEANSVYALDPTSGRQLWRA